VRDAAGAWCVAVAGGRVRGLPAAWKADAKDRHAVPARIVGDCAERVNPRTALAGPERGPV